jgi:peptide/nickel transport system substrate-binding protein
MRHDLLRPTDATGPMPTRRAMLAGAGAGLLMPQTGWAQTATPSRGGTLRLGCSGGKTSDTLDPRMYLDRVPMVVGAQLMNNLVKVGPANEPIPELLISWDARPGAREWIFNVRKDVVFHNGKTLEADDIIYSINLHRGNTKSSSRTAVENIAEIKSLNKEQIQITLTGADADLPLTLSYYAVLVVPDGFTDWAKPIGTGGFKLEVFEPGVRAVASRTGNYWRDAAWVDSVETIVINDANARMIALSSGQVDVVNSVDGRSAELFARQRTLQIIGSQTGQYSEFVMNCALDPFKNNDIRMAMKHAIDRKGLLRVLLNGRGSIGNDHPIPKTSKYFNHDLLQHEYDPDKSRFFLRKAGIETLATTLQVSDIAFVGATDGAALFQATAAKAGISIAIKREPSDGYWDNVWKKAAFCASYSGGRVTVDAALAKAFRSTSPGNETNWRRPELDRLADEARGEIDGAKRTALYAECQRMIAEDCGAIVMLFVDSLEASSARVKGHKTSSVFELMNLRLCEEVWLQS